MLCAPRCLLLFALLTAACDLSFNPDWKDPTPAPADMGAGEPELDASDDELDAAQDAGEADDAGAAGDDASVSPALLGCRVVDSCDGGSAGDAGCARTCIANCADVPCLPNQMCYRAGLCSVPCGWCIDLAPPIKARR